MADYINTSQYWGNSYWGGLYWGILTTAFLYAEHYDLDVIINRTLAFSPILNTTLAFSPILNKTLNFTYEELST